MLRRYHRFFQSIQVIRDAALVGLSFYLAYIARFSFPQLMPYESISPRSDTVAVAMMLIAVWPAVGWAGGLYVSRRTRGAVGEVFDVFKTSLVTFLLVVTVTYFIRDARYSRAVLLLWAVSSCVLIAVARVVFRVVLRRLRSMGYNLRHVLVVGAGDVAQRVLRNINGQPSLGLRVLGIVAHQDDRSLVGGKVAGVPVVGTISELKQVLQHCSVDQVIVALPIERIGALKGLMAVLSQETVDVRLVPDIHQYMTLCGSVEEFSGLPVINLQATPLLGWNMFIKRLFDILVAAAGLLIASPIMALLAALVRVSSPGPVLYVQERVGMDGKSFRMYKFRTMSIDAENQGERMTVEGDPRCTTLGSLLRRFSLDELPQLYNVLRGEMSLVGPRPERPCFIESFKRDIPRYALRHKIKAGMTGWAQINGMRGNTSIARRIELDLYYIENWSLLFDIKILLRTVFGGFLSPNAY